jgi:hypothetical protein
MMLRVCVLCTVHGVCVISANDSKPVSSWDAGFASRSAATTSAIADDEDDGDIWSKPAAGAVGMCVLLL